MSGAFSRNKGHSWERKVARDIREFDKDAKRLLEYQVGFGYDLSTSLPFNIQCKNSRRVNFIEALQEADVGNGKVPLAICKVTGKGEYAFLKWKDLLSLFRQVRMDV